MTLARLISCPRTAIVPGYLHPVATRRWGFGQQLAVLGVVGLVVRVVYAIYQRRHLPFIFSDATKYWAMANDLANGRWFIDPLSGRETVDHSPLYSIYLSIAGVAKGGAATQFDLLLWTCVLGTASVILVGLAGREDRRPPSGSHRRGSRRDRSGDVDPRRTASVREPSAIFTTVGIIWFVYRLWRVPPSLSWVVWLGVWCGLGSPVAFGARALRYRSSLVPLALRGIRRGLEAQDPMAGRRCASSPGS